jgi:FtsP/CotA-like multicopper oxidase with cupredoxin domain
MDHPFHLHGFFFQVIAVNGERVRPTSWEDTVNVVAKQSVTIAFRANKRPGEWMYHRHILEHHAAGIMGHFEIVRRPKIFGRLATLCGNDSPQ